MSRELTGFVSADGSAAMPVSALLDPDVADRADADANRWIKALRHAVIDGQPWRDRFTHRGDSLWWFAEIYLHKQQVVTRVFRALAALEPLADREPGSRWTLSGADPVLAHVARGLASRMPIHIEGPADRGHPARSMRLRTKALFHTASALADRLRPIRSRRRGSPTVAAFVHSAFLRAGTGEEAYTGPVLSELRRQLPAGALQLIGLGPRTNFRVRRWRDRLREFTDPAARHLPVTPIELLAGWRDLAPSRAVWRGRHAAFEALRRSAALRAAAVIRGCDIWPILEEQLRGIADLQFPWSARAMDEAAAALDRLCPDVVLTYAEAGGYGRALVLEARRRGIPCVALQHGFIYRHWLNYLHEPDEMAPSPGNPHDRGFPLPDCTLVFDDFTREHLETQGRFPPDALRVTGSPRLDALAASAARLDEAGRLALRASLGVPAGAPVALVAAKHAQMGGGFAALVAAMRDMPGAWLVVKPHPAEGADPYLADAAGADRVVVAPREADLGRLTAVASVLVTVNSTAAIEAMALDVPALVLDLPNNLSPFVEAGAMAGAARHEIAERLRSLMYDQEARRTLGAARRAFLHRYGIRADGAAARRAAEAVLSFAGH